MSLWKNVCIGPCPFFVQREKWMHNGEVCLSIRMFHSEITQRISIKFILYIKFLRRY
jgi:hypothetical protein